MVVGGRAAPDMPRGLSTRQQTAWRHAIRDLSASGVLDRADSFTVELLAGAVGRMREARAEVNRAKSMIAKDGENSQGRVASAASSLELQWAREARQLVQLEPLSAVGRARLGLTLARGGGEGADAEMEREIGLAPRLRVVGEANG